MIVLFIVLIQTALVLIAKTMCRPLAFKVVLFFNIWWMALTVISLVSPVGGYAISFETYLLLGAFIALCSIGFIAVSTRERDSEKKRDINDIRQSFIDIVYNSRLLRIATYVSTVLLVFYAIKYAIYIGSGNFLDARNVRFFVGPVFGSTIELLFYNYVISAERFLWAFIFCFALVFNTRKGLLFWVSGLNFLLYIFIGASRYPIVLLGVYVLVMFVARSLFVSSGGLRAGLGKLAALGAFALVLFLGMSYFTAYRRGMTSFNTAQFLDGMNALYEQIVSYNAGALGGLSITLEEGSLYNHWYFGRAVWFGGIEEIADNLCGFLGVDWTSPRYVIGEIANESVLVGTVWINALFTDVYWFYSDMGILGVLFYSLVFGVIARLCVNKFDRTASVWSLMIMTHVLYSFFLSNSTWDLTTVDSLVYIAAVLLFVRLREKKMEKRGGEPDGGQSDPEKLGVAAQEA